MRCRTKLIYCIADGKDRAWHGLTVSKDKLEIVSVEIHSHFRAGNYLKPFLVQVANAFIRSRQPAIIAVCYTLLNAIWNVLAKRIPYSPLGLLESRLPIPIMPSRLPGLAFLVLERLLYLGRTSSVVSRSAFSRNAVASSR